MFLYLFRSSLDYYFSEHSNRFSKFFWRWVWLHFDLFSVHTIENELLGQHIVRLVFILQHILKIEESGQAVNKRSVGPK